MNMDNSHSKFISKQVSETLVIKKNIYRYQAECIFVKNGVKQIWRYISLCDGKDNQREYKQIL